MKRRIVRSALAIVCLSLILFAYTLSDAQAQSKAGQKAPELIRVATYDVGATGYVMYGFLQEAIAEKTGTKIRAIPIGTDLPRMMAVKDKQAEFCGQGTDVYFASEGLDRYATRSWGPQAVRAVWLAEGPGTVAMTKGDSGIKTCADVKGKRIPWIPGSIFIQYHEALLRFCNLNWDDVKKVQISGFGAMTRALPEGKVDLIMAAITIPTAYELDSSPSKIRFLEMPAADKEGWKRAQDVNPLFYPYKATFGPGSVSEKNPVECIGHPYPSTLSYDFLDDNMAYFMTKAIHEAYPIMAKKSELMKRFWSLEKCLLVYAHSRGVVMHPGSVRYFKEIGVWKPEWDKLQETRLKRQKELKDLWNKALAEANSKGIKDADYPQFWLTKRAETFKELPE
jgi:TRAP transporter TAXI family solute receptor